MVAMTYTIENFRRVFRHREGSTAVEQPLFVATVILADGSRVSVNRWAWVHVDPREDRWTVDAHFTANGAPVYVSTPGVRHGAGFEPKEELRAALDDLLQEMMEQQGDDLVQGAIDAYKSRSPFD